jgi:hypothetical protein
MADTKKLVEEAMSQIKSLENVIAENAKGILASTMKEEISELVKESLKSEEMEEGWNESEMAEAEDDDNEMDDMDMDSDEDEMEMDMDSDEDEMEIDMDSDEDEMDMDSEVLDLTDASPEEVAKVFKKLGPNDKIQVVKDGDYLHIDDEEGDSEFLIDMRESDESMEEMDEDFDMDMMSDEMDMDNEEESDDDLLDKLFTEMEDEDYSSKMDMDEEDYEEEEEEGIMYEIEMEEEDMEEGDMMDMEEIMYEIEMEEEDMEEEDMEEEESYMNESKKMKGTIKPVVGKKAKTGSPKFSYEKSKDDSFAKGKKSGKETYKVGNGAKLGKAKFEFKEGGTMDGPIRRMNSPFKKEESKEASRTFGMGSKKGRGLRKGITPNRNLTFPIKENQELEVLRQKNEEYRRALNIFRDKLNEVAVFNSNLAYATRLFTEHSTTKQEKINILKRFDSVETLKESKSVYKTIKDELSSKNTGSNINESIENKIDKSISTGSAVNLMESKTYENPQFLRMKDIMSKIIK